MQTITSQLLKENHYLREVALISGKIVKPIVTSPSKGNIYKKPHKRTDTKQNINMLLSDVDIQPLETMENTKVIY